jgi:hypothetical protein
VTADVTLPLNWSKAVVDFLALPRRDYECQQIECWREAD